MSETSTEPTPLRSQEEAQAILMKEFLAANPGADVPGGDGR